MDLWISSCQTPLPKQEHLVLPRTTFTRLLNISKEKNSTVSLGNLCQCLVTLTVKKCFLTFRGILLGFSLCPWPLVLSLDTTGKSLDLSSLYHPCRYLCTLLKFPLSLLFSSLTVPALSVFPHRRGAPSTKSSLWPCTRLSSVCPFVFCTRDPRTGKNTPGVASPSHTYTLSSKGSKTSQSTSHI